MSQGSQISRQACSCGPAPQDCLDDDTIVTQLSNKDGSFRKAPRSGMERGTSVVIGSVELSAAFAQVTKRLPTEDDLRCNRIRAAKVGDLRTAGFAVVHTPGKKILDNPHASVVWPAANPLRFQEIPWSENVSLRFDACFNEV